MPKKKPIEGKTTEKVARAEDAEKKKRADEERLPPRPVTPPEITPKDIVEQAAEASQTSSREPKSK